MTPNSIACRPAHRQPSPSCSAMLLPSFSLPGNLPAIPSAASGPQVSLKLRTKPQAIRLTCRRRIASCHVAAFVRHGRIQG
jgi:hypothetical protein